MKQTRLRTPLIQVFFLLAAALTGCTPAAEVSPTAAPTSAILPSAQTRLETLVLPTGTYTPAPTLTRALTATWTVTPGPTNSVTPAAQFERAEVISVNNPAGGWQIAMRVPGLDKVLDISLETRKYTCQMAAAAPETLFCNGLAGPPVNRTIRLVFLDPQTGAEIYSGTTLIGPQAIPTETPVGFFSCPDRGKDIFCEVECRLYDEVACLVATCNDACGVYFSFANCPKDRPNTGICSSELEQELRKKYGIP